MRIRILSLAIFACALVAQSKSPREVEYPTMNVCREGGCRSPLFDKGYFILLQDYPSMPPDGYDLWAPDGSLRFHANILAPDGTPAHLKDVAVDSDGTTIAAMWYGGYGGKGRVTGGGLVVVDPAGKQTQFIDTARWMPAHPYFGPHDSIWVSGTQFCTTRRRRPPSEHRIPNCA